MNQIPVNFVGQAKRLDPPDIPLAAHRLGVPEDVARAVLEVEAGQSGFDAKGRPKMLFEPHRFFIELGEAKRRIAVNAGLAYRRWGEKSYPADSYPRLQAAIKIDRPAALRSASWGLPQILGSNHRAAGYATVEAMVADFCADEENHLRAMMAFITAEGLDDELRRMDWAGFARGYNGPAYARHGYHTKLAAAYAKWQRRPDTPVPAGRA